MARYPQAAGALDQWYRLVKKAAPQSFAALRALFGTVDAMKFRSSLTLFAEAAADPAPYLAALDRFFGGRKDAATLVLLRRG